MKAVINKIPTREECLASVNAIRDALFVLNGKWKLPLIFTLLEKSKRFNEIQQAVPGITPKILSKELKDLEENGFVIRTVYPTKPVTVIYEITSYSETLKSVLNELKMWGTQHRDMIKQSMRRTDAGPRNVAYPEKIMRFIKKYRFNEKARYLPGFLFVGVTEFEPCITN